MFRNYFKTAWRNLMKNKFYSLINIGGLSIGLAVGLLILFWVQDELSYNRFHKNASRIIKLENMVATGVNRQLWTATVAPIGKLAKQQIPGVQDYVRITYNGIYGLFRYQDKQFHEEHTFFVDPSVFSVFDFHLVKGNAANPFPNPRSVVITESTAKKYFGDADPIGKTMLSGDTMSFTVTGEIKDFPKNSDFRGDLFLPMDLWAQANYTGNKEGKTIDNDFSEFNYNTFLLLQPGFSFAGFAKKLRDIHLSNKPDDTDIGYVWLPLSKIHLYHSDGSEGGISTVRIFAVIALLILIIACINYVNLSTARSMLRAKEVSMRKIVGAERWQLFMQFIVETAVLFALASVLALLLIYALIPLFNQLSGKELVMDLRDYRLWEVLLLTILGTLIISSIYPAMLLSSFKPVSALKGKISTRLSGETFRKALVIVQFAGSFILIAGTIIIGRQLQYIRSRELGYNKENVLKMRMIDMAGHLDAVKADLMKLPGVKGVTWSSMDIINYQGQTGDNAWDGKENGETMMLSPMNVQPDFIPFFHIQLVEGKNFSGMPSDSMHFILNETAVKAARLKDPIGKKFRLWKTEGTIIGVVKDFHFLSMRRKVMPAIFYSQQKTYGNIYVKATGKDLPRVIAAAREEWTRYNAGFPFAYDFLDDEFTHLYDPEQRTGMLYTVFAAIAIFISCLGLFSLTAYTAQTRNREIGVRKVLGASVSGLIGLLAKDLMKLVLIGILIAVPVAWYLMNQWLQDFAYKTNIGWAVFVLAGLLALVIAFVTISFQSVKAALANPVKSLRSDN